MMIELFSTAVTTHTVMACFTHLSIAKSAKLNVLWCILQT